MITLANGIQTMVKGFGSTRPLPSLPLNFVLHVLDSPFNLISINKLICDLNCSITYSNSSVTLQDQNMRRTIGMGDESQSHFHLNSTPSALPWMHLFSSAIISIILAFPSSRRWFHTFPAYLQLSVSCVSLGNILVSRSLSA